ncbi:MAG TPA: type II toxin-antitoxin system HicB family antitoxin [Candidatus Paceibacterota bacterium]
MKVLNYRVKIHAAEEGGFWAEVPALPGCFTQGETLDEVRVMAKEAIEGFLEMLVRHGKAIPIEENEDVVGTLEIQVKAPLPA